MDGAPSSGTYAKKFRDRTPAARRFAYCGGAAWARTGFGANAAFVFNVAGAIGLAAAFGAWVAAAGVTAAGATGPTTVCGRRSAPVSEKLPGASMRGPATPWAGNPGCTRA